MSIEDVPKVLDESGVMGYSSCVGSVLGSDRLGETLGRASNRPQPKNAGVRDAQGR